MPFCRQCGLEVLSTDQFCRRCGHQDPSGMPSPELTAAEKKAQEIRAKDKRFLRSAALVFVLVVVSIYAIYYRQKIRAEEIHRMESAAQDKLGEIYWAQSNYSMWKSPTQRYGSLAELYNSGVLKWGYGLEPVREGGYTYTCTYTEKTFEAVAKPDDSGCKTYHVNQDMMFAREKQ